MAGKIISAQSATITAASTTGFITIASVTGYYKGAKAWLSLGGNSLRVQITDVLTTGNQLGVRPINDTGAATYNYGRADVSAYNGGRIDMEEQFVYSPQDTGLA